MKKNICVYILTIYSLFILPINVFSQQYTFKQYNIEDGLAQSQVNNITEDAEGRLIIATVGGLSMFDGRNFSNISKSEGLTNSNILSATTTAQNQIYTTSFAGISIINDKRIKNLILPPSLKNKFIKEIKITADQEMWGTVGDHLVKIEKEKIFYKYITAKNEKILAVSQDVNKDILVFVDTKGLYVLSNKIWKLIWEQNQNLNGRLIKILKDSKRLNHYILVTDNQIYNLLNNKLEVFKVAQAAFNKPPYLDAILDIENNLWVGSINGVYRIKRNAITHFTSLNGFTNFPIKTIYRDKNDDLWFGSNGEGVFKFDNEKVIGYGKEQGLYAPIFNIVDNRKGEVIFISGKNTYKIVNKKISKIQVDGNKDLQFVFKDEDGNIIGYCEFDGFFILKGNNFRKAKNFQKDIKHLGFIFSSLNLKNSSVYISSSSGLYFIQKKIPFKVEGIKEKVRHLLALEDDSILGFSKSNIYLIKDAKVVKTINQKELADIDITSVLKDNEWVWIGTFGDGLFLWDRKAKTIRKFDKKNSLRSDYIYSLSFDQTKKLWVGGGNGFEQFKINPKKRAISNYFAYQYPKNVVEPNQGAILASGNNIWVGTTKGLFMYNTRVSIQKINPIKVVLDSVCIFDKNDKHLNEFKFNSTGSSIPTLVLKHNRNKLAIFYGVISTLGSLKYKYQYRLKGIDVNFSKASNADAVVYSSLSPGEYVFEVKGISENGIVSEVSRFKIIVEKALYETWYFRVLEVYLFIMLIIALQYFYTNYKNRAKQRLESLRLIEQNKIRTQTAEDFHDDIGNKLTRISVLSEILESRLPMLDESQKTIIDQIKSNTNSLYNGTKDILWALDPHSDNLYEIVKYIKEFAIDNCQDTGICFKVNGFTDELQKVKLPIHYNRNLILIFKESINNSLKHANATELILEIFKNDGITFITFKDNGIGFNPQESSTKGRGIKNLKARSLRINSTIDFISAIGEGTIVKLKLNNI